MTSSDASLSSQHRQQSRRVPLVVQCFFAADLCIAGLSVAAWAIARMFHRDAPDFFRLSREGNLPTAYSGFQHAVVGMLFGLLAVREIRSDVRRIAIALPALMFFFFALDEVAMLHERIADFIATRSTVGHSLGIVNNGVVMLVALPLAILAVIAVARLTRRYWQGRRRVAVLFVTGMAMFLGAAGGLEILVNLFHSHQGWVSLETLVEETTEMLGVTVVMWSATELLSAEKLQLRYESGGLLID